jgi:hypothetical protein
MEHTKPAATQAATATGDKDMPQTPAEIAAALRRISAEMIELGTAMDYYGGNGEMAAHGRELVGAGHIAAGWADGIEGEQ